MVAAAYPAPQFARNDLIRLKPSQQVCLDHFRPLFLSRDQGVSFHTCAEGLLFGEWRKSIEQMALRWPVGARGLARVAPPSRCEPSPSVPLPCATPSETGLPDAPDWNALDHPAARSSLYPA